jgi:hypothetical protein
MFSLRWKPNSEVNVMLQKANEVVDDNNRIERHKMAAMYCWGDRLDKNSAASDAEAERRKGGAAR